MPNKLIAADLFCGAGGTSAGLVDACNDAGLSIELTAINHWDVAIATHSKNHPGARHLCQTLDAVNPNTLYKPGQLDLLWASPECTHHSVARGGRPVKDQSRATAWCVTRWATALMPNIVLVENVPEFEDWGPLIRCRVPWKVPGYGKWLKHPRCSAWRNKPSKEARLEWQRQRKNPPLVLDWVPDPKHKGELFQAWIETLRSAGYKVEWRVLCAADYGDPTSRQRLFIYAVRGRRKVIWPEPTHADPAGKGNGAGTDLFGHKREPWRTARNSVIDWSIAGHSIYKRKRPLADNTMERIYAGLQKFCGLPFIVGQQSGSAPRMVDSPVPTITTTSRGMGLAQPYLVKMRGTDRVNTSVSVDKPLDTVTAGGNHFALAQPYLVEVNHGASKARNDRSRSIDQPMGTLTAKNGVGLAIPFLIQTDQTGSNGKCAKSIDGPCGTVVSKQNVALVQPRLEPFILGHPHKNGGAIKSVDDPLLTVTATSSDMQLVQPMLKPYIVEFNGSSDAYSVDAPHPSVSTKQRHGLCQPTTVEINGNLYALDILFRMLNWKELGRAQGFRIGHPTPIENGYGPGYVDAADDYQFTGTNEFIVRQIGNAVPRRLARALCRAAITQKAYE